MRSDAHLLPGSANAYERGMSLASRFGSDILPEDIKSLWRPEAVQSKFLPFLAWAMHVDFWRDALSDEAKRSLITGSFEWHRLEGTFGAIRRICEAVFGETQVRAWHEYGGEPFSFRVSTEGYVSGQNQEAWDALFEAIHLAKALRDWLDAVEIRRKATLNICYGHGSLTRGTIAVSLAPKPSVCNAGYYIGYGHGTLARGAITVGLAPKPSVLNVGYRLINALAIRGEMKIIMMNEETV
jgi:phage tail P2-like protein